MTGQPVRRHLVREVPSPLAGKPASYWKSGRISRRKSGDTNRAKALLKKLGL